MDEIKESIKELEMFSRLMLSVTWIRCSNYDNMIKSKNYDYKGKYFRLRKLSQANSDLDLNAVETELTKGISSVTRQRGESLNGCNKKTKQLKFAGKKKKKFSPGG